MDSFTVRNDNIQIQIKTQYTENTKNKLNNQEKYTKKRKTNFYKNQLAVYGWIRQQKQEKLKLNLKQLSIHVQ